MAAVSLLGSTINTTAGAKTVTASPAAGDLIVVVVIVTSDTTWSAPTDDQSGTYDEVYKSTPASPYCGIYIRSSLIPTGGSTTFTLANPGSDTGGGLAVLKVTGMVKSGYAAFRQGKAASNVGGTTPETTAWSSARLTSNPTISLVANSSNPAGISPSTGHSELLDTGYSTPTTGLQIQKRDSGDSSSASIAWNSTSATDWRCASIELDASSSGNFFLCF